MVVAGDEPIQEDLQLTTTNLKAKTNRDGKTQKKNKQRWKS